MTSMFNIRTCHSTLFWHQHIKSIFSPYTVPDTQQVINCVFRCLHMAGRQYCHHSWTLKSRSW